MRDWETVAFCRFAGPGRPRWKCFDALAHIVQTRSPKEVAAKLAEVQRAVAGGLCAAGLVSYEAAPGLDAALSCYSGGGLPLVWFALFHRTWEQDVPPRDDRPEFSVGPWSASISPAQYYESIGRIKDYIARGHTYQVNYTFRLRAPFDGEPWGLFQRLCDAQRAQYCAYLDLGSHTICSASPELFFDLDGEAVLTRPMKGTAPRGRTAQDDRQVRGMLAQSPKDRAENAMIVNMMRNDLGRIAQKGSVQVTSAFDVEKYPTVYQMTSTVTAKTAAPLADIMRAVFPAASVTGAPKVRTMEIIRELEPDPRGVYTGCIGWLGPGRRAAFSVAIRTVTIDRAARVAEYGTGGGIVWDSQAAGEFAECGTKAAILTADVPQFKLLETILYRGRDGYDLLKEHLDRLANSAEYFDFVLDLEEVRRRLAELADSLAHASEHGGADSLHGRAEIPVCREKAALGVPRHRVRSRVDRQGQITLESAALPDEDTPAPWKLRLARTPIDPRNVFLYHKTTWRAIYETACASRGGCDDVVLWNPQGQATETTVANLVVEKGGRLVTPPVACGLLPGVVRQHLLDTGQIHEDIVTLEDLRQARRIAAVNSIRGQMPAVLVKECSP